MDIYQISWTCPECKTDNRLIVTETVRASLCQSCGEGRLSASKFQGSVYVLSNPRVEGVKIGRTAGDPWKRAKQISGTGVPGEFEVMAIFASHRPEQDEKKVHSKLEKLRIGKEHFALEPAQAAAKLRTTLSSREPVFVHPDIQPDYEAIVAEQRETAAKRFQKSDAFAGNSVTTVDTEIEGTDEQVMDVSDLFSQQP